MPARPANGQYPPSRATQRMTAVTRSGLGEGRTAAYRDLTWPSQDRRSLGGRVEADNDLGAIGDVHLIARLQAPDEGLHSRV